MNTIFKNAALTVVITACAGPPAEAEKPARIETTWEVVDCADLADPPMTMGYAPGGRQALIYTGTQPDHRVLSLLPDGSIRCEDPSPGQPGVMVGWSDGQPVVFGRTPHLDVGISNDFWGLQYVEQSTRGVFVLADGHVVYVRGQRSRRLPPLPTPAHSIRAFEDSVLAWTSGGTYLWTGAAWESTRLTGPADPSGDGLVEYDREGSYWYRPDPMTFVRQSLSIDGERVVFGPPCAGVVLHKTAADELTLQWPARPDLAHVVAMPRGATHDLGLLATPDGVVLVVSAQQDLGKWHTYRSGVISTSTLGMQTGCR